MINRESNLIKIRRRNRSNNQQRLGKRSLIYSRLNSKLIEGKRKIDRNRSWKTRGLKIENKN